MEKEVNVAHRLNDELVDKLNHRNCVDCSNHSSKLKMRVMELDHENKNLKSRNEKLLKKYIDRNEECTKTNLELCKAKEYIRTLISCLIDWVQEGDKDYCHIVDANQFLKEIEG